MEKMIAELKDNDRVEGQYLIVNVAKCLNERGAYLNMDLRDSSGVINAKKWEVSEEDLAICEVNTVINVVGTALKYKDALQLKIHSVSRVDNDHIDTTKFIKKAPIEQKELIAKFNHYLNEVRNPDCKKIIDYLINRLSNKIYEYPAAVSVHHDYLYGLLMHTTSMLEIAEFMVNHYPDVDKDLLYSGVILHDLGKTIEFEGPVVFKYSLEGRLLGHITIMVSEIRKAAEELHIDNEIPLLLEHMVLSHHGQPDYGSPVLPLTKEAMLLSMIDNLDSKMVIMEKALENVKEGEFSQKVYPLDGRFLYKPKKKD